MIHLEEAEAVTDRANELFRFARVAAAECALALAALTALALDPDARYIGIDWSDQGEWIEVNALLDGAGHDLADAAEDYHDLLNDNLSDSITSLGSDNLSVWQPYVNNEVALDILAVLDAFVKALNDLGLEA